MEAFMEASMEAVEASTEASTNFQAKNKFRRPVALRRRRSVDLTREGRWRPENATIALVNARKTLDKVRLGQAKQYIRLQRTRNSASIIFHASGEKDIRPAVFFNRGNKRCARVRNRMFPGPSMGLTVTGIA